MWELVSYAAGLVVFILLLELLELPEWISQYMKGRMPRKQLEENIRSLESRINELEKKITRNT